MKSTFEAPVAGYRSSAWNMHQTSLRWLIAPILAACTVPLCAGISVLILGDSVDRHIVEDWCAFTNSTGFTTAVTGWGPKSLKYGGISSIISPSYCANDEGDSIAQIHLFGSSAHGPYYSDKWEMDNSEYEVRDSTFRTTEGIRIYIENYGVPDRVFIKTMNWDNALLATKHDPSAVNNFLQNTEARLLEIESAVGKDVQIGVMTAPQVWYGGSSIPQLNVHLREYAARRNLLFYDFDLDVWSSVGFQYNQQTQLVIMRGPHDIHPKATYSVQAANKILGRAYSGYFMPQGRNSSTGTYYSAIPKGLNDFVFVRGMTVVPQHGGETAPIVKGAGDTLSYLEYHQGGWQRWSSVPKGYMKPLRLGHQDVMSLLERAVESIPPVGAIPRDLFLRSDSGSEAANAAGPNTATEAAAPTTNSVSRRGISTVSGQCIANTEGGQVWLLPDTAAFRYLHISPDKILGPIPDRWLDLMGLTAEPTVPQWLFTNWTLVRQHTSKQVYIVSDYQRRAINSVGLFYKYGFDFADVKVSTRPGEIDLLPEGLPLE